MTDCGRIINTEALDRIKLSEKLPPFRKQRRGTEIFIFDNRINLIYDFIQNYSAKASLRFIMQPFFVIFDCN